MYPIPDRVFERYNVSQLTTKMGLFAEINHAWASIDNGLFLWDYTHPNPELIGFEDQPHGIRAVALVPPKPGVFVKDITHILVVATTTDIILLGVAATPTPTGGKTIALYQTKMAVHRGSSEVSVIAGSSTGRILVGGGSDTDVHEIYYQQEEKWFSSRVGKINHTHPGWSSVVPILPTHLDFWSQRNSEHLVDIVVDDSRKLVYTLSNMSTIRTYHMDTPNTLTKVIEKERIHCLRDIGHMTNASRLLTAQTAIVSISPISAQESSKLHLMALTNTGCRLFLSATSSASYMLGTSSNLAPQSMQVQFVKFPPRIQSGSERSAGQVVGPADQTLDLDSRALTTSRFGQRFAPGHFFDFVSRDSNPDGDSLFVSAPETGKIMTTTPTSALKYCEHGNWIDLGARSRALAVGQVTKTFAAAKQPLGFGNELAVQFDQPPSEYAVLANDGIHIVRRRRLVDIFAAAIRNTVGDDGLERETRKFINLYGRVETISAALAVACGQGSDLRTGTGRAVDQAAEDRAKTAFVNWGGQPTVTETDGNTVTVDSVKLSSRHDALGLYLTRLIRTLWKARVISLVVSPTGVVVNSTIPTNKLTIVQENLERLRNFLRVNAGSIQGLSGPSGLQNAATRHEEIAVQAEHQALHALQQLMESISEGISFVLMLFDERVADIYVRLDEPSRQQFRDLTYENLFSQPAGKDLAKLLVKAIVNRNIASGSNVETVADALRRRCGSFCSPDDVVVFKAQEQLQRASEKSNAPNVARSLLNESLRLFERVAGSLSYPTLQGAVAQYVELRYYAGAIQLCLAVAKEKDRGNTALSWINEGRPANDRRQRAWDERKRCYDLIHDVMRNLDTASASEPEVVDGRLTLSGTKRMEAYTVINDSDDEVFHFDLYQWYIDQNWTDRILSIESPHVISFLQRLAAVDARHAELLCRFYTHRGRFFDAAQVQYDLAKSNFDITIKDRITLLSRAKGNASVSTTGVSRQQQQQLNHEVTELLEIAHIQDDLLGRLTADKRFSKTPERLAEIDRELNGPVLNLSEVRVLGHHPIPRVRGHSRELTSGKLFNSYADQAEYYDLCLLIYNAADYHNPRIIADTWRRLINTTHEEVETRRARFENPGGNSEEEQVPPPQPYEAVSVQIQTIAHRTSLDSLIFPVDVLLSTVCEYALTNQQDATIGADPAWPVLLFLQLGVSHAMIVRVLERILDTQEAPFTGRRRKAVVEWINAAVDAWVHDVERRGISAGKGDLSMAPWVVDLMERAEQTVAEIVNLIRDPAARAGAEDAYRTARGLRTTVGNLVRRSSQGGLKFR